MAPYSRSARFGAWNTITLTLPAVTAPLYSIGVQFHTAGTAAWTAAVYVDSIGW